MLRRRLGNVAAARDAIIDSTGMGQLIVRNVDDRIIRALKLRAAGKRRSAEAEHREILREALTPRQRKGSLKDLLLDMPAVGDDDDFGRRPDRGRRVEL